MADLRKFGLTPDDPDWHRINAHLAHLRGDLTYEECNEQLEALELYGVAQWAMLEHHQLSQQRPIRRSPDRPLEY